MYAMYTSSLTDADIIWTASASISRVKQGQWIGTLPKLKMMDDKCGMAHLLKDAWTSSSSTR